MSAARTERRGLSGVVRIPSLPFLLLGVSVVVGIVAFLPLSQSSSATAINGNIQRLERQKADWQARLHEMEVQAATLGSLDRIDQEARSRLQMEEPKEVHYLPVDAAGPEPLRLPSRFLLPQPADSQQSHPSLWEKLFGSLPLP